MGFHTQYIIAKIPTEQWEGRSDRKVDEEAIGNIMGT